MKPHRHESLRSLAVMILVCGLLCGQPPAAVAKEFDAVSIRPHTAGEGRGASDATTITRDARVIRLQTVGILRMITFAYDIPDNRVQGLPPWTFEPAYDCQATSASPVSLAEQRVMLQRVLEDRFGLVVHRTMKEGKVYTLGLLPQTAYRLTASGSDSQDIGHFRNRPMVHPDGATFHIDYVGAGVTIADLVAWLSQTLHAPVEDRTGIKGRFDITVSGPAIEMTEGSKEDTAQFAPIIRAQLGLNLEAAKGSIESLVVDQVRRPSEN